MSSIGTMQFDAGAPGYSFTLPTNAIIFSINGTGIVNNSGNQPVFFNNGTIQFLNGSVAGNVGIVNDGVVQFQNTSSAATGVIITSGGHSIDFSNTSTAANSQIGSAGLITFRDSSTAGAALIFSTGTVNFSNSATAGAAAFTNSGAITFTNSSTAGSANIQNNGGGTVTFRDTTSASTATITNNSNLNFNNSSTAASANISSSGTIAFANNATAGSATIAITGGNALFTDTTTAANATINNQATLSFLSNATAGAAQITNANTGTVQFSDFATGGTATINNSGTVNFGNSSNAGTATLTNAINTSVVNFNNSSSANGATISNAGTLQFADTSSASNAVITNTNSLIFTNSSSAGGAAISNNANMQFQLFASAGDASITNNSNLTFSNTSTASNATIVNNSAMAVNDDSRLESAIITNNGTLGLFGTAGAGNATIVNNGILGFLDSSSADTAAITTNSGGLTGFAANATGNSARLVTNAGGAVDISGVAAATFQFGSIAGAGTYSLGNKQLTVGLNDLSTEVSGVIADGGLSGGAGAGLTKAGNGTLTLSGTNTYTGATVVNNGALIVNGSIASSSGLTVNAGLVGGTGTLPTTTVNAAFIAPGPSTGALGTLTVQGNLTLNGSITSIGVTPTGAGQISVTGTASLGGTVAAASSGTGYTIGQVFTIVNATGGLGGTTFAGLDITGPVKAHLAYDANNAFLVVDQILILQSGVALNQNQKAVATVIDGFGGTLPPAFAAVGALSTAALPGGLSQLTGETATGAQQAGFQSMSSFLALMLNPVLDGRGGLAGAFAPGLAYASTPTLSPEAAAAYAAVNPKSGMSAQASAVRPTPFGGRYGVWGGGYGGQNTANGDAAIGSTNTTTRVGGFAVGVDYFLSPSTVVGFALAGGATSWSLASGFGSGKSEAVQLGFYGTQRVGAAYFSAAGGLAYHFVSTDRTVTIAGMDRLTSSFNAFNAGGRLETGYRFGLPIFGITPYAAFQAQLFRTPTYTETASAGAGAFALTYDSRRAVTTRVELGTWFDKAVALDSRTLLLLRSRIAWAHDSSSDPAVTAGFQTLPGSSFTVFGAKPPGSLALLSLGGELFTGKGWSFGAKFDGEFASGWRTYAGTGTARYTW
jgi:outer membrane autotransporter protein